jgi:hypothetical protein
VTENSIIYVARSKKSVNTRDWASLSIWVTEFSVTFVLWSCVTLGFSNSVFMLEKCSALFFKLFITRYTHYNGEFAACWGNFMYFWGILGDFRRKFVGDFFTKIWSI